MGTFDVNSIMSRTGAPARLTLRTQLLSSLLAIAAIAGLAVSKCLDGGAAGPVATVGLPRQASPEGRSRDTLKQRSPLRERRLRVVVRTARNLARPEDVDTLVERLVHSGATEAWVQFKQDETDEFVGGSVFYPSSIAPVAAGFEDDRLARLVERLDDRGVRVCAWIPCLNDASATAAHPEWCARTIDPESGERITQPQWLCPRSAGAIAYEGAILAEVAKRYPRIEGVYTDFIRLDSDFSCACDRCLEATAAEAELPHLAAADILRAAETRGDLWHTWTDARATAICAAVDSFRDRIDSVNEGLWFGACVLPFSSQDYSFNTQSGQDLFELARVGLDEIVVMGYWDDWGKSYAWLTQCVRSAEDLVRGEAELSCLIDGDMSLLRTWRTLNAVSELDEGQVGFFHYGEWDAERLATVQQARLGAATGAPPPPDRTAVAIRIDTEPDAAGSYETVSSDMIDVLVDLFDSLGVKATFVTCGRIAELQPEALRRAASHGHEIACHAYDHEQLDAMDPAEQIVAIDRGIGALRQAGLEVRGFGAPRNSITPHARRHLIELGLEWDGSLAYDPMTSSGEPEIVRSDNGADSITLVPFIVPNDWDALHLARVSTERMLELWRERLDRAVAEGAPVFVIDVHQWMASRPSEMAAIRTILNEALRRPECRVTTVGGAALHAREHIATVERAAVRAERDAEVRR